MRELIEAAEAEGYSVPISNLERWRSAGLLPTPVTRPGKGQGLGRVGLYPRDSVRQLLALLRMREEDKQKKRKGRVDYWGWRLWEEGFDVLRFVRPRLVGFLAGIEARLRKTRANFEAEDPDNAIDQAPGMHFNRELDAARRRAHPESFSTPVGIFVEMMLGQFTGKGLDGPDEEIVARTLNPGWQRKDLRIRPEQVVEFCLTAQGYISVPELRGSAETASDEDLKQVRDEIRTFLARANRRLPSFAGAFVLWFIARKGSRRLAARTEDFLEYTRRDARSAQRWAGFFEKMRER